jgi:oligosaccharide repeat unit polymerase
MIVALIALLLLAACLLLRGTDWTRPHIVLLVPWYGAVALSQLRLTSYQTPWSSSLSVLALAGPLILALASSIADGGGSRAAFAHVIDVRLDHGRLRMVVRGLLLGALVGSIIKFKVQGGLALFSSDIDATRGTFHIPGPVTLLTDGFFLSAWLNLIGMYATRRRGRPVSTADLLLLGISVFGATASASRNTILLTLAVPFIFAYVIGILRRPSLTVAVALVVAFLAISSGLFYIRTNQHSGSAFESSFYSVTVPQTPLLLRPFLPIYVSTTAPFETLNRITKAFPLQFPYEHGWYSISLLPKQTHLHRANLYAATAVLSEPYYFNVATYEGPLYGDGGPAGVLLGSALIGLAIGVLRRRLARRASLAGAAVWAYVTYTIFFMAYDQLYSIFFTTFTDIFTLWLALRFITATKKVHTLAARSQHRSQFVPRRDPVGQAGRGSR